jgi:hypothetical protein
MITVSDWFKFINTIPGGPRVVIQEGDLMNSNTAGVVYIYCHQKFISYFKKLDQYTLKPCAIQWKFTQKSHAWLKKNAEGNQITFWIHQKELK